MKIRDGLTLTFLVPPAVRSCRRGSPVGHVVCLHPDRLAVRCHSLRTPRHPAPAGLAAVRQVPLGRHCSTIFRQPLHLLPRLVRRTRDDGAGRRLQHYRDEATDGQSHADAATLPPRSSQVRGEKGSQSGLDIGQKEVRCFKSVDALPLFEYDR